MSAEPTFYRLPVEPDAGLPQAFRCPVGGTTYDFALYANFDSGEDDPPEMLYDLTSWSRAPQPIDPEQQPVPPGHLVLRVTAPGPDGPRVLLQRKLVPEPDLVHEAGPLAVKLVEATVARGNLNGAGHYGSRIVIGVARRWE
ncbi:hypothetical protein DEJ44_34200 [Streptomyces venezuelae]|uniref:hypothetical protein n=1 Tax=Streptomyces venezuelae TaxID=54571 RepID=UPI0012395A31|nr:hypothetical protein [Streptomyces venezuelae]QES10180.1 hypothetical protein DEJ44_34200 [Streptomyces venezuelae]